MPYRTLEIGPGDQPRHDIGGVNLNDGEEYVALDVNPKEFEDPIWKQLRNRFGDKVRLAVGSREAIPDELGIFDEVVMLGSQGTPEKDLAEIDRVLGENGILKLGVATFGKANFLKEWFPVLQSRGYDLIDEHQYNYVRTMNRGYDGITKVVGNPTPKSYTVFTFRKN